MPEITYDHFWEFMYEKYVDSSTHASGPHKLDKADYIEAMEVYFKSKPEEKERWFNEFKSKYCWRKMREDERSGLFDRVRYN